MPLEAITERSEISLAANRLIESWQRSSVAFRRKVGWQGGGGEYDVHWIEPLGIWGLFSTEQTDNRFWCCYGFDDPSTTDNLSIACEVNFPFEGINRRVAGVFARDPDGQIRVCHSGKIGGGRAGASKENFVRWHNSDLNFAVDWPDGGLTDMYVISSLGDPRLPAHLCAFVDAVQRFKHLVSAGLGHTESPKVDFSPEFSGTRRSYEIQDEISAECNHGAIVDQLYEQLLSQRFQVANDRHRDLYVVDGSQKVRSLFEVKTCVDNESIYKAIGQLMVYSTFDSTSPKLFLVLPDRPNERALEAFIRLNISVITFRWNGVVAVFEGIDDIDFANPLGA